MLIDLSSNVSQYKIILNCPIELYIIILKKYLNYFPIYLTFEKQKSSLAMTLNVFINITPGIK